MGRNFLFCILFILMWCEKSSIEFKIPSPSSFMRDQMNVAACVWPRKKGQLISIDEGHLFMRCFCSPNCFLNRTTLFWLSGLKAYCVKWCMIDFSNSSDKTPTYLFQFKHWRVDCFSPVTFEGRNDHVKDLADFSEHTCAAKDKGFNVNREPGLPVNERKNPGCF